MHHRILISVVSLLLVIVAAGCQKATPALQPAISAGTLGLLSWSPNGVESVPGIDQAYIAHYWIPQFTKSRHLVLLLWFDVHNGSASWSERTDGFDGTVREIKVDDISIEFHLKSKTSDIGTLMIAGMDYDTKTGSLFLISTEQGELIVKQLKRSVTDFDILTADGSNTDKEKLKALASSDSDISTFFREAVQEP